VAEDLKSASTITTGILHWKEKNNVIFFTAAFDLNMPIFLLRKEAIQPP